MRACLSECWEDGRGELVNVWRMASANALLPCCSSAMALISAFRAVLLLTTHSQKTRTNPHHELGEGAVRLLLGARKPGLTSTRLFISLLRKWRRLNWHTVVLSPNEAIFLRHGEVGFRSFVAHAVAGGRSAMAPLDLARLLLVSFLHGAYLLSCSFLLLGLFFFLELAAGFLDGLGAYAGVDFAAAAYAEALVN